MLGFECRIPNSELEIQGSALRTAGSALCLVLCSATGCCAGERHHGTHSQFRPRDDMLVGATARVAPTEKRQPPI